MDKETIAEYKGLVAFVDKCEREQASDAHKINFKTKIKNVYDSHSLAAEAVQSPAPGEPKIRPSTWPLGPKALKIKPRQHYHMTTDPLLAETLESTVHQQACCHFPGYLHALDLQAEEKTMQQTVKSTAHMLERLLNVPKPDAASNAKPSRRRSQATRKASRRARASRSPLLNWQDILDNAQTAGWPSAVIERARARLTSYYCPSEMLNE